MSSSRTSCSASESTSLRVELRNCASTTRQKRPRSGRTSEGPAHRVQILGDTDEPRRGGEQRPGRLPAEVRVARIEPTTRLVLVAADQRVQAAEHAEEKEREAAFGGIGRDGSFAVPRARYARGTGAEDGGKIVLRQSEAASGSDQRGRDHVFCAWFRLRFPDRHASRPFP